jgi:hypothetical protein
MRRATELGDNAGDVAGCLETAADVLMTTKTITYWCLKHLVVGNLLKEADQAQQAQYEHSLDPRLRQVKTHRPSIPIQRRNKGIRLSTGTPDRSKINKPGMDLSRQRQASADRQAGSPLDLLLDRQHGETVIRNLIVLVLNGKIDGKGRKPVHPEDIQAWELAQSVYESMKKLYQQITLLKTGRLQTALRGLPSTSRKQS